MKMRRLQTFDCAPSVTAEGCGEVIASTDEWFIRTTNPGSSQTSKARASIATGGMGVSIPIIIANWHFFTGIF